MLRRLYDWCLGAADKPQASWWLGAVSFAESSFFPVPPDVMLIPMSLARPDRAYRYALVCTITSVIGGLLGYLIGAVLYDTIGHWVIETYGYGDKIEALREAYRDYGVWIILLKGLTPIPYKVVTIAAGIAYFNLPMFIILSVITRGARFFVLAFLLNRYGAQARAIIEKRLGFWLVISAAIVIIGFVIVSKLL